VFWEERDTQCHKGLQRLQIDATYMSVHFVGRGWVLHKTGILNRPTCMSHNPLHQLGITENDKRIQISTPALLLAQKSKATSGSSFLYLKKEHKFRPTICPREGGTRVTRNETLEEVVVDPPQ